MSDIVVSIIELVAELLFSNKIGRMILLFLVILAVLFGFGYWMINK